MTARTRRPKGPNPLPLPRAYRRAPTQTANTGNKRSSKTVAATITVTPFNDPAGNPLNITIVSVTANRGAPPTCPCTGAQRRSGCACVPDAAIVSNKTAVSLLPLMLTTDATKKEVGTTVRIVFNATAPATGMSCQGYVELCSARTTGAKPPRCNAYGATRTVRDLTVCSG